jgi:hypothetical protein
VRYEQKPTVICPIEQLVSKRKQALAVYRLTAFNLPIAAINKLYLKNYAKKI